MKSIGYLILFGLLIACKDNHHFNEKLVGKWKIYKTRLNQRDISKSADPKHENGLEFKANGDYLSFGNARHQGKGTYELKGDRLLLRDAVENGTNSAMLKLQQDTLSLEFSFDSTQVLSLRLYRMKEEH
ncbi:hypothetical protein [Aureispira anguillae]|uniref:Lipocalin-like domain-containing protein n=1 Tax=Aureispira anguillae TaxID=2864201 RepID=A0A916DV52_9BACT|nr:hypothetical protein [Aureispira anguillae]BDS14769.1 hypothetical protein AsAng_0055510 [Aureispira anguillae]